MEKELYLVFRYLENGIPEFCGIFEEEHVAVKACITPDMCVCPAILNKNVTEPNEVIWPRAWYPMLEGKPGNEGFTNLVQTKLTPIEKIKDAIFSNIWENTGYCPDVEADAFQSALIDAAMKIEGTPPKGFAVTEYISRCSDIIRGFLRNPEMKRKTL